VVKSDNAKGGTCVVDASTRANLCLKGWAHGGVLPSFAMVETHTLTLALRAFLNTYPWRRIDPVPVASLEKPVSECIVALVSSAGFVVPGEEPFSGSVRGGDFSFRVVPCDVDVQSLEEHHRSNSFSHAGVEADRNMGLPLDRLHELAAAGEIGSVAPRHISVMGSITAPGRFVEGTLPAIANLLVDDNVDIALMVPV
jgi:D-proline reductase (dithiol) PrdB